MPMNEPPGNLLTYTYIELRKSVGLIGIALPIVLWVGINLLFPEQGAQPSISHYYHTGMGDVFVGALCAVALFMFFYTGYDKIDNIGGHFAGMCALGVAWFPTSAGPESNWVSVVHFTSAALLFLTFAWFALFRFTLSKGTMTPRKKIRNKTYRASGCIILICIATIALYKLTQGSSNPFPIIVYWAETIALIAFGTSWIIKGEMLLGDQKN